jgi:hypothetical protein
MFVLLYADGTQFPLTAQNVVNLIDGNTLFYEDTYMECKVLRWTNYMIVCPRGIDWRQHVLDATGFRPPIGVIHHNA